MDNHTLQQVIDLAVKTAVLREKKEAILECRPIGSYFLTETEDDPNILFGGGVAEDNWPLCLTVF